MKIDIACVGKLKSGPEQVLFERYMRRSVSSGVQLGFTGFSLKEYPESRAASSTLRKQQEAELFLKLAKKGGTIIALDEHGSDLSSEQFAKLLANHRDEGTGELIFSIGGPDGHGTQLLKHAKNTIRFGKMTWPHQIARILLAEQIYRATTILSGHPYHRR